MGFAADLVVGVTNVQDGESSLVVDRGRVAALPKGDGGLDNALGQASVAR